jgi:glyoxylase-like metal-dependent hydrolase (beta-lactamase superfamily II)
LDVAPDESEITGEWQKEGVYQVSQGVYRVPLPLPSDGLRAVNVYILADDNSVTLIDSGWANEQSRGLLISALHALELAPHAIDRFLVTHMHRDHSEQAMAFRRDFGTKFALGRREYGAITVSREKTRDAYSGQLDWLRVLGAGDIAAELLNARPLVDARPVLEFPDVWLEAGDLAIRSGRVLVAVPTPGHTRGHFVFHDHDAHLLFAGDHVLPTITPSIGFEAPLSDNPLGEYLASLALVRARPDARLLPAHGPVAQSVHSRIDELLHHHARRLDLCVSALDSGCRTAHEVAERLRWTRRDRQLAELDVFNAMLAVSETGAHLSLLVSQGRAAFTLEDGIRRYSPA